MRRLLVPLLIALTAVAACADPNAQPGRADPTVAEPAPTELLSDGSVPWADLNHRRGPQRPPCGAENAGRRQRTVPGEAPDRPTHHVDPARHWR